ncbi:MAG: hypothetical protein HRT88_23670, partial [Lentisphaeraceae bacterium]|nr:hypothetical protein [Lentisphaeraceae bacterium]
MPKSLSQKDNFNKAVLYMLFSSLCFSLMGAFIKLTGKDIPLFEKVLMRN